MRCFLRMAAANEQLTTLKILDIVFIIFFVFAEKLMCPLAGIFMEHFLSIRAFAMTARLVLLMSTIKPIHRFNKPNQNNKQITLFVKSPTQILCFFSPSLWDLPQAIIIMRMCAAASKALLMLLRLQRRFRTLKRFQYRSPWKQRQIKTRWERQCRFILNLKILLHRYHKRYARFLEYLSDFLRMTRIEEH